MQLADIVCTAPLDTTYDIAAQIARGGTEEAMFGNALGDDPAVWDRASPPHNDAVGKAGDTVVTPPLMDFFRGCTRPRTA